MIQLSLSHTLLLNGTTAPYVSLYDLGADFYINPLSLDYLVQHELATLAEIDPEGANEEETPPSTPASTKKPLMTPSPSPPGANKKVRKVSPIFLLQKISNRVNQVIAALI